MFALLLVMVSSAPVPSPKPQPDLKPGIYRFKWSNSEWGTVTLYESGFYSCRYRTKSDWMIGVPVEDSYVDCHYEGKWSWDPKTRQLTIREVSGYYNPWDGRAMSEYIFRFERKLDVGTNSYTTIQLRPYK